MLVMVRCASASFVLIQSGQCTYLDEKLSRYWCATARPRPFNASFISMMSFVMDWMNSQMKSITCAASTQFGCAAAGKLIDLLFDEFLHVKVCDEQTDVIALGWRRVKVVEYGHFRAQCCRKDRICTLVIFA